MDAGEGISVEPDIILEEHPEREQKAAWCSTGCLATIIILLGGIEQQWAVRGQQKPFLCAGEDGRQIQDAVREVRTHERVQEGDKELYLYAVWQLQQVDTDQLFQSASRAVFGHSVVLALEDTTGQQQGESAHHSEPNDCQGGRGQEEALHIVHCAGEHRRPKVEGQQALQRVHRTATGTLSTI